MHTNVGLEKASDKNFVSENLDMATGPLMYFGGTSTEAWARGECALLARMLLTTMSTSETSKQTLKTESILCWLVWQHVRNG